MAPKTGRARAFRKKLVVGGGVIAFPPCTDLAASGAGSFKIKKSDGRQKASVDFFMLLANCKCDKVAIENPVGIMSKIYMPPDQIINPFHFGDKTAKKTCLWLKGLPKLLWLPMGGLFQSTEVTPEFIIYNSKKKKCGKSKYAAAWKNHSRELRGHIRSKTFPGIARAMAEQWGPLFT